MNWKEFTEIVFKAGCILHSSTRNDYSHLQPKKVGDISVNHYLMARWAAGGMEGGSYDGSEAKAHSESDPEAELEDLDKLLMLVCPAMAFLQYKRLLQMTQKTGSFHSGGDYYGNYTNYNYKAVNLGKLFEALHELNLLPLSDENTRPFPKKGRKKKYDVEIDEAP